MGIPEWRQRLQTSNENTGSLKRKSSERRRNLIVLLAEKWYIRQRQLMGDLPQTPPFHYSSCNYFGPYNVKIGRNEAKQHYGVIFICLGTRAVHLELAIDLSIMQFIQVLRIFFFHPWLPGSAVERQWVADYWRRAGTAWNGGRFRFRQTLWFLRWKKHPLAVHCSSCSSSEWLCWSTR